MNEVALRELSVCSSRPRGLAWADELDWKLGKRKLVTTETLNDEEVIAREISALKQCMSAGAVEGMSRLRHYFASSRFGPHELLLHESVVKEFEIDIFWILHVHGLISMLDLINLPDFSIRMSSFIRGEIFEARDDVLLSDSPASVLLSITADMVAFLYHHSHASPTVRVDFGETAAPTAWASAEASRRDDESSVSLREVCRETLLDVIIADKESPVGVVDLFVCVEVLRIVDEAREEGADSITAFASPDNHSAFCFHILTQLLRMRLTVAMEEQRCWKLCRELFLRLFSSRMVSRSVESVVRDLDRPCPLDCLFGEGDNQLSLLEVCMQLWNWRVDLPAILESPRDKDKDKDKDRGRDRDRDRGRDRDREEDSVALSVIQTCQNGIYAAVLDKNAALLRRCVVLSDMLWMSCALSSERSADSSKSAAQYQTWLSSMLGDKTVVVQDVGRPAVHVERVAVRNASDLEFVCYSLCEDMHILPRSVVNALSVVLRSWRSVHVEAVDLFLASAKSHAVLYLESVSLSSTAASTERSAPHIPDLADRIASWSSSLGRTRQLPVGVSQLCGMYGARGLLRAMAVCVATAVDPEHSSRIQSQCEAIAAAMTKTQPPLCSLDLVHEMLKGKADSGAASNSESISQFVRIAVEGRPPSLAEPVSQALELLPAFTKLKEVTPPEMQGKLKQLNAVWSSAWQRGLQAEQVRVVMVEDFADVKVAAIFGSVCVQMAVQATQERGHALSVVSAPKTRTDAYLVWHMVLGSVTEILGASEDFAMGVAAACACLAMNGSSDVSIPAIGMLLASIDRESVRNKLVHVLRDIQYKRGETEEKLVFRIVQSALGHWRLCEELNCRPAIASSGVAGLEADSYIERKHSLLCLALSLSWKIPETSLSVEIDDVLQTLEVAPWKAILTNWRRHLTRDSSDGVHWDELLGSQFFHSMLISRHNQGQKISLHCDMNWREGLWVVANIFYRSRPLAAVSATPFIWGSRLKLMSRSLWNKLSLQGSGSSSPHPGVLGLLQSLFSVCDADLSAPVLTGSLDDRDVGAAESVIEAVCSVVIVFNLSRSQTFQAEEWTGWLKTIVVSCIDSHGSQRVSIIGEVFVQTLLCLACHDVPWREGGLQNDSPHSESDKATQYLFPPVSSLSQWYSWAVVLSSCGIAIVGPSTIRSHQSTREVLMRTDISLRDNSWFRYFPLVVSEMFSTWRSQDQLLLHPSFYGQPSRQLSEEVRTSQRWLQLLWDLCSGLISGCDDKAACSRATLDLSRSLGWTLWRVFVNLGFTSERASDVMDSFVRSVMGGCAEQLHDGRVDEQRNTTFHGIACSCVFLVSIISAALTSMATVDLVRSSVESVSATTLSISSALCPPLSVLAESKLRTLTLSVSSTAGSERDAAAEDCAGLHRSEAEDLRRWTDSYRQWSGSSTSWVRSAVQAEVMSQLPPCLTDRCMIHFKDIFG